MTTRTFTLAAALLLGLTGLAQAQAGSGSQEPGPSRGRDAPGQQAPGAPPNAQAEQPPLAKAPTQAEQPRAEAPRPRTRVRAERRPREYRSARYRGGNGATWKTGRDAYGFGGSYGGCSYRGNAGPNGYRLDRRC